MFKLIPIVHFWLYHIVVSCTLAHGFWISRKGGTGGGGWGHLVGDMHMVTASLGSWLGPGELLNLFINALSGPGFSFGVRAWAEMDICCGL